MARKIVSQTNDYTIGFPSLDFPFSIYLEEDAVIDGVSLKAGETDPRYPADKDLEVIELMVLNGRVYHSVHGDYTAAMLKPTADNDYVIEKTLDGNFTHTVLLRNTGLATKYKASPDIISVLGLPAYDPAVHTTDLYTQSTINAEHYARIEALEEEKRLKAEEEAALEDKPSEEELAALAFSLAGISSGTITADEALNNN